MFECEQGYEKLRESIDSIRRGTFSSEEASQLFDWGREAVTFVLLALAHQKLSPHSPSSATPTYEKPSAKPKKQHRGAKRGHTGHHRPKPERIDQQQSHQFKACPDCGGRLKRTGRTRTRYTEDIPDDLKPITTEHTIHRDWCRRCKRQVEPRIPDALPNCTLGVRTLVYSAWLHYSTGVTLSQVREVFNSHLQLKLSDGGLCQMWRRLAELLTSWYEQLQQEALDSALLHADETGWRVDGQTHWLWCFTNRETTFYLIDRSRGSPALQKFFQQEFAGTLVSDFWSPYAAVCAGDKQKCWAHLLRELDAPKEPTGEDWDRFTRRVKRLFKDAIKLRSQREELEESEYDLAIFRLENRAARINDEDWSSPDAKRLAKRVAKHEHQLFTFLWYDDVDPTNNLAEREIRPAVQMRKNSYQNSSQQGALTQAILMTIFRTLKRRGYNPLQELTKAIRGYAKTGKLPKMPNAGSRG